MSHVHVFFMHTCQFCFYHIDIKLYRFFSACFSLSLSFVSFFMAPKRKSTPSRNPLCSGGHLLLFLLLTLLHLTSGSVMIMPVRMFWKTFHDTEFIRNAKSYYRTFPILTFLLSSTIGVGSHYVASRSLVLPWSYRSFTPTCTDLTILYLSLSLAFEVCEL